MRFFFVLLLHETLLLLLQESAFQYYQMSLGVAGQGKFPFRIFFYYFLARLFVVFCSFFPRNLTVFHKDREPKIGGLQ